MDPDSQSFVTAVAQAAGGIDRDTAQRAAQATLQTLAERIAAGEARDLAGRLPPEVASWLWTDGPAERFDVDEFLRRVAEREAPGEAVAPDTVMRHARAVLAVLRRAVGADEMADVAAELPREFGPLLAEAEGRFFRLVEARTIWDKVAERTGLDPDAARRATEATLETLAERIAGGEVDDLIAQLPADLHPPLRRGRARADGRATPMELDTFLRRIAQREGTRPAQALVHARAVFETLREALPPEALFDITAQLPDDYVLVGARPGPAPGPAPARPAAGERARRV